MRKSNVIDNAFAQSMKFAEFDFLGEAESEEQEAPEAPEVDVEELTNEIKAELQAAFEAETAQKLAEQEQQLKAEWTAKMNKAFEQGLAQGETHAAEKIQPLIKALRSANEQLAEYRTALDEEVEQHAVDLAIGLAETVLRTQVMYDEEVLHSAMNEVMHRVPRETILKVRVHPADMAIAEKYNAAMGLTGIELLADETIGRGGCRIDTRLGEIQSTLQHRWQAAEKLLLAVAQSKAQPGQAANEQREQAPQQASAQAQPAQPAQAKESAPVAANIQNAQPQPTDMIEEPQAPTRKDEEYAAADAQ